MYTSLHHVLKAEVEHCVKFCCDIMLQEGSLRRRFPPISAFFQVGEHISTRYFDIWALGLITHCKVEGLVTALKLMMPPASGAEQALGVMGGCEWEIAWSALADCGVGEICW